MFAGLSPSITSLQVGANSKGQVSRTQTITAMWHSTILPKYKGNKKDAWQSGLQVRMGLKKLKNKIKLQLFCNSIFIHDQISNVVMASQRNWPEINFR